MKFSFLLIMIGCLSTSATFAGQISCASPSGESLSFQSDGQNVTLSYESSRGAQYAPIEDGPVRQISAPYYKMEFQDLKGMLAGFSMQWTAAQCSLASSWWLSACNGVATMPSDPQKKSGVQGTGVSLAQIVESGASGTQTSYRFRLVVEKSGNTYFVPISFPQEYCQGTL